MRVNLFAVALLLISINIGLCENCNESHELHSKGFVSSFIKYLDIALDYFFRSIFGNDKPEGGVGSESNDVSEERGSDRVSYRKFQLLRIWPRTDEAVEQIRGLTEKSSQVQFWLPLVKNASVDVVLPPSLVPETKEELEEKDVEFTVQNSDIEKVIASQILQNNAAEKPKSGDGKSAKLSLTQYHTLDDIYEYLDFLQDKFENLVEVITIGKSSEGRELQVIRISTTDSSNASLKPAIWIDAGIHAREWISVAVALFIIKQLVESNKSYKNLVQDMDWYILPVANPDGYVYTHTTDRLWTKSIGSGGSGRYFWEDELCKGVDLYRNWDYRWNEDGDESRCKETYAGESAFSEPETRSMSNFILEHRDKLIIYLSLHSYSQKWLMPSNPSKLKLTNDYEDLLYMGRKAIESLKKAHGTNYELVTKEAKLYPVSGTPDEWAKNKVGIKYSYTIELRDKGIYGFLLPPTQIQATGKETFTAIRTLIKSVLNNQVKNIKLL